MRLVRKIVLSSLMLLFSLSCFLFSPPVKKTILTSTTVAPPGTQRSETVELDNPGITKFLELIGMGVLVLAAWFWRKELGVTQMGPLGSQELKTEFNHGLLKAADEFEHLPEKFFIKLDEKSEKKQSPTDEQLLLRLTEVSPRAAITEAWRNIEVTTKQLADALGISVGGNIAGKHAINEVVKRKLLPNSVLPIYERMRKLRSQAAHAQDFVIDKDEAKSYIKLAYPFYMTLQFLLKQTGESQKNTQHKTPPGQ